MTMACIAILTTSCNQTDLIKEEFSEANTSMLARQLAANPNFQASIKIHEQIGNDLKKSIKDNNMNITNDDLIINSSNTSILNEDEFASYKSNLLTDMPELNSITNQAFEQVFSLAINSLDNQELSSRNCAYQYYVCVYYNAYIKYFYGQISYNSYIAAYYACVQEYYRCT